MTSGRLVGRLRGEARDRIAGVRRELARPWREGRSGAAAEIGRWMGLGAALGAVVVGVAAGLRIARRD